MQEHFKIFLLIKFSVYKGINIVRSTQLYKEISIPFTHCKTKFYCGENLEMPRNRIFKVY